MPMDAKTRAKLIAQEEKAWSLYNIENIRSQLETQIEKQQREQQFRDDMAAAEAARIDAEVQARLKEQQQAQAAKQQQQKQAGQQKSLTEEVPSYNINAQNPTGNLQQGFEMPRPGGGVPPFTSGPRGPGVPGSADEMMGVEMPGVGAAPPFLVNQQRTSEVAPYRFSDYLVAPARTNRVTTNIEPNVLTAAQRQQALLELARTKLDQKRWEQERQDRQQAQLSNTWLELRKEGITANTAGIAAAMQAGNIPEAQRLMGKQSTLYEQVQRARMYAAETNAKADLARIRAANLTSEVAILDWLQREKGRSILEIAGLPDFSDSPLLGSKRTPGQMSVGQLSGYLDNNVTDKDGKIKPGQEAPALGLQSEMLKKGVVLLLDHWTENPIFWSFGGKKGSKALSLNQIIRDYDLWHDETDVNAGARLEATGLFDITSDYNIDQITPDTFDRELVDGVHRYLMYRQEVKDATKRDLSMPPEATREEVEEPAEPREEEEEAAKSEPISPLGPKIGSLPQVGDITGRDIRDTILGRVRRAREAREEQRRRWLERAYPGGR